MRTAMDPWGRRSTGRTVPLDTALALRDQAQTALTALERARNELDRARGDNSRLRDALEDSQQALEEAQAVQDDLREALARAEAQAASAVSATAAAEVREVPPEVDGLDQAVLSLRADLANVRRHQQAEVARARREGEAAMLTSLADTLDDLERAKATVLNPALESGLEVLVQRLRGRLAAAGFEVFGEVGEAFDPARHEALGVQPGPVGTLVAVVRHGLTDADGVVVRTAQGVVGQGGEA